MKNRFVLQTLQLTFGAVTFALACGIAHADNYQDEWEQVQSNTEHTKGVDDEETVVSKRKLDSTQNAESEKLRTESSQGVRKFHEVLDELLAEFGYDVRMGQLKGLENLSIRKIEVSDALPDSYHSYVELLVAERIRENSQVRLVSCLPCKTKTSHLVEGKLMITSPTTNTAEMRRAADQLGINNFMDVVLVYHTTHMVLAMQVFNTGTQDLVWARTYNSETVKSRYQKLAVDYAQVAKARPGEDYVPEYRFLVGMGGAIMPNVSDNSDDDSMASFMVRGTERFNNRKTEFGLQFSVFQAKQTLLGSKTVNTDEEEPVEPVPEAWTTAFGLYGVYAHNFIGSLESYNLTRHGVSVGLGIITSPASYLAGSLRGGWDIYFGRRFAANFGLYYVAPSRVVVEEEYVDVDGGVGAEIAMSVNM